MGVIRGVTVAYPTTVYTVYTMIPIPIHFSAPCALHPFKGFIDFAPRLFRISDYHFDVFLDHVRQALASEDPEAADLAPAQLEALRPNVVLDSRAACPVSGATGGRGCPFKRMGDTKQPLLEKVGGTEEIEKILTHMEREAQAKLLRIGY